jgi:hypothetical protein
MRCGCFLGFRFCVSNLCKSLPVVLKPHLLFYRHWIGYKSDLKS